MHSRDFSTALLIGILHDPGHGGLFHGLFLEAFKSAGHETALEFGMRMHAPLKKFYRHAPAQPEWS